MKRTHILLFCLLAALLPVQNSAAQEKDVSHLESPKEFRRKNTEAVWSKLTKETMAVPYFAGMPAATVEGFGYMESLDNLDFWEMDSTTVRSVLDGQVPTAMRQFRLLRFKTAICDSVKILRRHHIVEMWILPEYVSVGCDRDCVRMPMGPIAAQQIADTLGCCLPTTYLVDRIYDAAEGRIDIFPFRPFEGRNQTALVYHDSNNAIKALYKAYGYKFGQLISGLKKDIVLTSYVERNPECDKRVAIYGWQHPDGTLQQPLFIRHGNFYADYSHGVRLIWHAIKIDGVEYDIRDVLCDPALYRILSDEPLPLKYASYSYQTR